MEIRIYHNPRCSKSRGARALLEEAGYAVDEVRYLESGLSAVTVDGLAAALGVEARAFMRTGDALYRQLGLADADERAHRAALVEHPSLLERPIVVVGAEGSARAVVCRPPERVWELLAADGSGAVGADGGEGGSR